MKIGKKTKATTLLLFYFLLIAAAFYFCRKTEEIYSTVSLRYDAPISAREIKSAYEYMLSEKTELQISFWSEKKADVFANNTAESAICIAYFGNARDCFHAEFMNGAYAGYGDVFGCAISSELAWQLFKSYDILGQRLRLENKSYIIRGVFKEKGSVALFCEDENAQYNCAELKGVTTDNAAGETASFLKACGMRPDNTLYSGRIAQFLEALCFFSLLILFLKLVAAAIRCVSGLSKPYNEIGIWLMLLCASAMLFPILDAIPAWLLPSQWSDFTHWSRIIEQMKGHIWSYATLIPYTKDALAKIYICLSTITAGLATAISLRAVVHITRC